MPGDQTRVEAALQNALAEQGLPVPRVVAAGDASGALGGAFLVMERVPGTNLFAPMILAVALGVLALAPLGAVPLIAVLLLYWGGMTRLLSRLHEASAAEVEAGLEAVGIPAARLGEAAALTRLEGRIEEHGHEGLRGLARWLRENAPPPPRSPVVCHGDFWFGNVMISRQKVWLIDWTQACLSHKELDLGWMSIQHMSRLPTGGRVNERLYSAGVEILRPLTWLFFGANRLAYQWIRGADRGRVRYYAAWAALRVLVEVADLRAALPEGLPREELPALLDAWGSLRTIALLEARVRDITGAGFELPPGPGPEPS